MKIIWSITSWNHSVSLHWHFFPESIILISSTCLNILTMVTHVLEVKWRFCFLQLLLMKAIIVMQPNQYPQYPTNKGKTLGPFCLREEPWDSALPGNQIYGKAVFIADLVLIVSQLSRNLILFKEAAIRFIYWNASKNLFSVESGQVSSLSCVLLSKEQLRDWRRRVINI